VPFAIVLPRLSGYLSSIYQTEVYTKPGKM
jgi:hypothetical protein